MHDSMEGRPGYFAFKALCYNLGHFLCQVWKEKHFLETDRKFQSTGNRSEQISAFHLVFGGYQRKVITWDRDCCSASGLGQVAIGQMSLWQIHQQSWRLRRGLLFQDLFADKHKAVFVVLVQGAIKYEGEELILMKEPKNELVWKANYLHCSICGLSSSGWGHVGRMNKQSLLLLWLIISMKELFSGLRSRICEVTKYIFNGTKKKLFQSNLPPSP